MAFFPLLKYSEILECLLYFFLRVPYVTFGKERGFFQHLADMKHGICMVFPLTLLEYPCSCWKQPFGNKINGDTFPTTFTKQLRCRRL